MPQRCGDKSAQRSGNPRSLGLTIAALAQPPAGDLVRVQAPRAGLYKTWGGNMDGGWKRWHLEQYEFPYMTLRDKDIRAGNLHAKFDSYPSRNSLMTMVDDTPRTGWWATVKTKSVAIAATIAKRRRRATPLARTPHRA